MTKIVIIILIILGASSIYYVIYPDGVREASLTTQTQQTISQSEQGSNLPPETVIAEGLDTPWAIAFLPEGDMLITERPGRIRIVQDGSLRSQPITTITQAKEIGEGGLLGITLHPNFESNHFVYLYYTYKNTGDNTLNRVVRMTYENDTLRNEKIIVDAIPGASNHNGGRIEFGPDSFLYITTGDAQEPSRAQDTASLAGKILRVTDAGEPAPGNPFNNRIYSYGHRNPQGITWDSNKNLWATEHGRSGITSGLDELNLIEAGKNYGWPEIQGDETRNGMQIAKANSGNTTWAPAGATYWNNSIYFGGLRGRALYKAEIHTSDVSGISELYSGAYGRIREVVHGPDSMLYISTSNKDGRGIPSQGDDRIVRIRPK